MTTGKKLVLGCFVGVPIICCLGGLLVTQLAAGQTETELKRELRITRDAGIPTEASGYEKMTSVPDDQNAERQYLEIFKGMGEKTQVRKDLIALQNGMSKRAKAQEISAANVAHCSRKSAP
jgi:propanediol dehydratase small subunit